MLPFHILERIESEKIKYLCKSHIEGIHQQVGKYFYLYLKDFYFEEGELEITIGMIPKPKIVFISKYVDPALFAKSLLANADMTIIRLDPGKNKNPLTVNKYNLHRLLCPTNHKHNLKTELERTNINLRSVMSSNTLVDTQYGGIEGIRIDPLHLGGMVI